MGYKKLNTKERMIRVKIMHGVKLARTQFKACATKTLEGKQANDIIKKLLILIVKPNTRIFPSQMPPKARAQPSCGGDPE